MGGIVSLPRDAAHVWYVQQEEVSDERLLARYEALLAPDEREQERRFLFQEDRREYLVTRALVRTVLSLYRGTDPADWYFSRNRRGRPEVEGPGGKRFVRFNLSNTQGLVACAVTRAVDIGIDVEDVTRSGDFEALAERCFSALERQSLRRLPSRARRRRFFEYWTLGEAYIKARGLGLEIPLDKFSFCLDEGPEVRIECEPELGDRAEDWQFRRYRLGRRHQMALAVRCGRRARFEVCVRPFVPLLSMPRTSRSHARMAVPVARLPAESRRRP